MSPDPNSIRILAVVDHPQFREAIAMIMAVNFSCSRGHFQWSTACQNFYEDRAARELRLVFQARTRRMFLLTRVKASWFGVRTRVRIVYETGRLCKFSKASSITGSRRCTRR